MSNNNLQITIAVILRSIGSNACLEKAKMLEKESTSIRSLHLRSLNLSAADIKDIASLLRHAEAPELMSISFSYNPDLGDAGATALATSLPNTISEIGLVNCGIRDAGGIALLEWAKEAPQLKMLCIEQNRLSAKLKSAFQQLSENRPQLLVVT